MEAMEIADWINLGILAATAFGLGLVGCQLKQAKIFQKEEYTRQQILDTFEFYESFRKETSEENRKLIEELERTSGKKVFSKAPMTPQHVELLLDPRNKTIRFHAFNSLRLYERLGCGVTLKLFSFEAIYLLSRSEITGKFGFYSPYITAVRDEQETAYRGFETLVGLIADKASESGDSLGKGYQLALSRGLLPIQSKEGGV